tara:strand:+ start:245 stop:1003 length:759 start_codon:yes stop_codon:yes gene_type:complete
MAGKVSELLKEKWVLYLVTFLAVLNLIGYVMVHNTDAVIVFLLIGYLTTFFNKNMIVVSLCAMIFTNLLVSIRHHEDNRYYQHIYREGLENNVKSKAKSKDSSVPEPEPDLEPDEAVSLDEGDSEGHTKNVANDKSGADNVENENLSMIKKQNMKKLDAMKNKMGFKNKDTDKKEKKDKTVEKMTDFADYSGTTTSSNGFQNMMAHQEALANNIKMIEPMVDKASMMLEKLGGVEKIQGMLGGAADMMGKFS